MMCGVIQRIETNDIISMKIMTYYPRILLYTLYGFSYFELSLSTNTIFNNLRTSVPKVVEKSF